MSATILKDFAATNPAAVLVLILAFVMAILGYNLASRYTHRPALLVLAAAASVLAVPAVLFTLYYKHLFDSWAWFYQFRSLPYTELLASGLGFAFGMAAYWLRKLHRTSYILFPGLFLMMVIFLMVPYVKPIIIPLDRANLCDKWEDNVCMQTTASTCGPASAATIFRHFGMPVTEAQLAREAFTSGRGTENWYLARAFRRRDLAVIFQTKVPSDKLSIPCIAGVRIAQFGHFIAILPAPDGNCIIADPFIGAESCPLASLPFRYEFTGFQMAISAPR